MAYLLEFLQDEISNIVGVFDTEENAVSFIESIPFTRRNSYSFGDGYYMRYEEIPELYTASYKDWNYVISKSSYIPGEVIDLALSEISLMDSEEPERGETVSWWTRLDGYSFSNGEIADQIEKREALIREARKYFLALGREVELAGFDSEDGSYAASYPKHHPDDQCIEFHLDPQTIELREQAESFEAFLEEQQDDQQYD